jgi:hypothetical protein
MQRDDPSSRTSGMGVTAVVSTNHSRFLNQ